MNFKIVALACTPLLASAVSAQGATRESYPSRIGSHGFVDMSLKGLDESSLQTSDGSESESATVQPSASRVAGRLEGQPGDIVVALLDEVAPGEYSLSDLPLKSAVYLGPVGNDGQFELREGPGLLASGTVALAVLPFASRSTLGPSVARVCLYTLPSGPLVCGCGSTPGWDNLGGGTNSFVSAVRFSGRSLFAGGNFIDAGGVAVSHVARWNGSTWSNLQGGVTGSIGFGNPVVYSLENFQGRMYAGGHFLNAGGAPANYIASFNTTTGWMEPAGGVYDPANAYTKVTAMVRYDDGGGNDLYVAGDFRLAGGAIVNDIARWDGTNWSSLNGGTASDDQVDTLGVYKNGSSNVLVAAGGFGHIGGVAANLIAQWDGTTWAPMGSGVNNLVYGIQQFGNDLYVAGAITLAGGVPVSRIAKWDGSSWSDVGGGTDGNIFAMEVFDDGTGPALVVTGNFNTAGGVATRGIATWNGSSWSGFVGGELAGNGAFGIDLEARHGCLAIGGTFTSIGGQAAYNVAIWRPR